MSRHARMVWGLGLVLGCGGTETGNPLSNGGETAGGGNCEVVRAESVDLAAETALGFRANDVLAYAGGQHDETLTWQALRLGSYGPESGQQPLSVGVAVRSAKLVQYANKGDGELASNCGEQLELDTDVTLKSAGGALDESVRATLVAKHAGLASLDLRLDPAKLNGTLRVTAPQGWTTTALALAVQFTPYALSGSLTPSFEQRTADSVGMSAGSGAMATFGLPPCEYGVPVPLSASGAASSASTLGLLADHASASLGGQPATLGFEPGDSACQYFGDTFSPEPEPALVIPGTLVVKTGDGSIDGRWPVRVHGMPDATGALSAAITIELDDSSPAPGSLEQRYGFTQLATSGYDGSSLEVTLALSPVGWAGSVVVYGFTNAACPAPDPGSNSSPPCPGADRTELARLDVR